MAAPTNKAKKRPTKAKTAGTATAKNAGIGKTKTANAPLGKAEMPFADVEESAQAGTEVVDLDETVIDVDSTDQAPEIEVLPDANSDATAVATDAPATRAAKRKAEKAARKESSTATSKLVTVLGFVSGGLFSVGLFTTVLPDLIDKMFQLSSGTHARMTAIGTISFTVAIAIIPIAGYLATSSRIRRQR